MRQDAGEETLKTKSHVLREETFEREEAFEREREAVERKGGERSEREKACTA